MKTICSSLAIAFALILAGCALEEVRTPQPDTPIFGRLDRIEAHPTNPSDRLVWIEIDLPEALVREGHSAPEGLHAEVVVDASTIVIVDGSATALDKLAPGSEVAVLPRSGTTIMRGVNALETRAAFVMEFASFAAWRAPRLLDTLPNRELDPSWVLSTHGAETSPLLIAEDRVLYFTSQPRVAGEQTSGHGELPPGQVRTFRSQFDGENWSVPTLVEIPGVTELAIARITWIADDETECLLTLGEEAGQTRIARSRRDAADQPWGDPEDLDLTDGLLESDASMLPGGQMVFVSDSWDGITLTLFLQADTETSPRPLGEPLFTTADQTSPRVGAGGQLFFSRAGQQMVFDGSTVEPLRFADGVNRELADAAPSADGKWLVFSLPTYGPGLLDTDVWIASIDGSTVGAPQRLDTWQPAEEAL